MDDIDIVDAGKEPLVFNGVDGASGDYLLPPLLPEQVSAIAQGETPDPVHLVELKRWWMRQPVRFPHRWRGLTP